VGVSMTNNKQDQSALGWRLSWSDLRREFLHDRGAIEAFNLETEEAGQARARREGRREATRRDAEDVNNLRFAGPTHSEDLEFYLSTARSFIPELEEMFERELATLDFLKAWGAFQFSCGLLLANSFRRDDAFDKLRTATVAGHAKHADATVKMKFVAALTMYWLEKGEKRKHAEREAAKAIAIFVAKKRFPMEFTEEWFSELLVTPKDKGNSPRLKGDSPKLRPAYTTKRISEDELRELAAEPRHDIPPIENFLPALEIPGI